MNAPTPSALTPPPNIVREPLNAGAASPSLPRAPFLAAETDAAGLTRLLGRAAKFDMLLLAAVRAVLAIAGTLVIWVTPQEPERYLALTYASLIAYSVYGVCVMWLLARSRARLPHRALAWVDVAFAGYLVTLTDGTNSIFFFFFFFAILLAAFTRGFREGLLITVASVVVFVAAALVMAPFPAGQALDRTLIRPVYLLALGFLVSHWGGSELKLKRQLALLREIAGASHARAGADAAIDATLRRLRVFFGADSAVLALERGAGQRSGTIYTASRDGASAGQAALPASAETMRAFMAVPERATTWPRSPLPERYVPVDTPSRILENRESEDAVATLAHLLEARRVAIAAYRQGDGVEGRLVLSRARRRFTDRDAAFLAQCARALAAVVGNIALTRELIAHAAEYERLGISRDLHDTAIQPYIGLRMAIEGVAREFRDSPPVAARLAELVAMTQAGIEELREYATRLRSGGGAAASSLKGAIERHAHRLSRYYGLDVGVDIDASLQLATRVADAVFQMVAEGLSNVARHTTAKSAHVAVRSEGDRCVLEIANPIPDGAPPPPPFVPRSLAERAADLGGGVAVKAAEHGYTLVTVSIPLRPGTR